MTSQNTAIASGKVIELQEFYAKIQLDGELGFAILHISQIREAFLAPPISAHLSLGEPVEGLIVGRDRKTGLPEISARRLQEHTKRGLIDTFPGALEKCSVIRSNDSYALIETPAGPGVLLKPVEMWSRYDILFASGLLDEGQVLDLVGTNEQDESKRRVMNFAPFRVNSANEIFDGEIVLIRANAVRKKDTLLRNILYIHTGDGFIVRAECNSVVDIHAHYQVGQFVRVKIIDHHDLSAFEKGTYRAARLRGLTLALIEEPQIILPDTQRQFQIGETVTGIVVGVSAGATVLIEDNCKVFLPASLIVSGMRSINTIIQCGDYVKGTVIRVPAPNEYHKSPIISLVCLVDHSTVAKSPRNPLVDVVSEKKSATRGGFARDAEFRMSVLEVYRQTCCVCGKTFSIGSSTAMQAGHIIPRAKRGADSIPNGLCFCPIHHWSFDRGFFCLDENLLIQVSSMVRAQEESSVSWLLGFHGRPATFVVDPNVSQEALEWHRRNVFLGSEA